MSTVREARFQRIPHPASEGSQCGPRRQPHGPSHRSPDAGSLHRGHRKTLEIRTRSRIAEPPNISDQEALRLPGRFANAYHRTG